MMAALLAAVSCNKAELPPQGNNSPSAKEYVMSIGLSGEITGVTITDLTKAGSSDLYGIQVYSSFENQGYKPYAYGLFTSLSGLSIRLLEGYQYKFEATLIIDGKDRIKHYSSGYSYPFKFRVATTGAEIGPAFIYATDSWMNNLGYGITAGYEYSNLMYFADIDRYYGELSGYTPSEGGKVTIDMKRTAYCMKVIAEGLTEGSLTVTCSESPDLVITSPEKEKESIYSFKDIRAAWEKDDYSVSRTMSFVWTKADGTTVPVATQAFEFYRNKRTTINVKVIDDGHDIGVGVNTENAAITNGNSYQVVPGSSSDQPIE